MAYDVINEDTIRDLVHTFYDKVRSDDLIGPFFNEAIGENWAPHLATMVNFWSGVMLTNGAYKGNPMAVHGRLKGVRAEFFPRWLALFGESARQLFEPDIAEAFIVRANRIAASIRNHTLGGAHDGAHDGARAGLAIRAA